MSLLRRLLEPSVGAVGLTVHQPRQYALGALLGALWEPFGAPAEGDFPSRRASAHRNASALPWRKDLQRAIQRL